MGSACTIKCIYTRHLYVIRRREIYYILLFLSLVGIFEMPQSDGKKVFKWLLYIKGALGH